MPWSNQSGGGGWKGGGSGGPWGQGPQGSGGSKPPDLEELLKRSQDKLKQAMPGGGGIPGPFLFFGAMLGIAVIGYLLFAVSLGQGEVALVTRFGKYDRLLNPGLHLRLPWPVEEVEVIQPQKFQITDIGNSGSAGRFSGASKESSVLTGDENIADVEFQVQWSIKNVPDYVFNIQNPELTVKEVAESAMREVIGQLEIVPVTTTARPQIAASVKTLMQSILDRYGAGILVDEIKLRKADPPEQALDAFKQVQNARTDFERFRSEATAYANKIVPEARGDAERILQGARAYKEKVVADANGQTQRFLKIYDEYKKAPEVTRRRMFLETMEQVMGGMDKVIIDGKAGSGVVPYMNLQELTRKKPEGGQ